MIRRFVETMDQWRQVVDGFSMHEAWPHPIRLVIDDEDRFGLSLTVELDAPCVNTGEMQTVKHRQVLPWGVNLELAVDFVGKCIRWAVIHELDECVLYLGQKFRDPHERDRRGAGAAKTG